MKSLCEVRIEKQNEKIGQYGKFAEELKIFSDALIKAGFDNSTQLQIIQMISISYFIK